MPPMHDIPRHIADILLELEAGLRVNGKWSAIKPGASALESELPFCIDTLAFEEWLQWIFLPRMKEILEQQHPFPAKSGILPYAEEYLDKNDPFSNQLLNLLKRFDDLINLQSSTRLH